MFASERSNVSSWASSTTAPTGRFVKGEVPLLASLRVVNKDLFRYRTGLGVEVLRKDPLRGVENAMGVPKFYRWLSERYPCLSEVVKEHQIPEFDNLYLDMNGIIHICSHPNDDDPHFRISEEKIFESIFHYIEVLFRMIQPKKVGKRMESPGCPCRGFLSDVSFWQLFFMAVDGVAPRAKMNQQRSRRFKSAKEAELNEKKARDRGEELPKEARFDSNCITPGTP